MGNGQNKMKIRKNLKRDALTGRIISDSKEVIIVDNAIEYVKKMGYNLIPIRLVDVTKTLLIIFLCLISLMLLSPLTSAQPPQTQIQQFPDGLAIIDNPQSIIQINRQYQMNFFVYNQSNGVLIDNSTVTCNLFVAGDDGEVVFEAEVDYFEDGHWGEDIPAEIFNRTGYYSYGISCQDGGKGGALAGSLEVVEPKIDSGTIFNIDLTQNYNIIFIIILFGIALLMIYLSQFLFASISVIIAGFIMLFNQVNPAISFVVIAIGIFFAFYGGKK